MFVLFEEAGKHLAGRILSEADSSLQVELDSGKRVKVKSANALLKFEKPAPADLIAAAQKLSADIELELAWEFASDDEFGFADLARDYFSADPSKSATLEQQAAALFRLFDAPHYFRRAGKGRFKKAPLEILQLALAAIEKKKQAALQITSWATELGGGTCPEPIRGRAARSPPSSASLRTVRQLRAVPVPRIRGSAGGSFARPIPSGRYR